jgi:glycosyltransferase involved in cell wall biosynthesis
MNPSGDAELHLRVESELPREIAVGRGNLLLLHGWCFHALCPTRRLEVEIDGEAQPLTAQGMPRPDVAARVGDSIGGRENAYRSGFWGLVKLRQVDSPRTAELRLVARLDGGRSAAKSIGELNLTPGPRPAHSGNGGASPSIAICMATYNPDPELFRRQVESIREQSYGNWICLVCDDASRDDAFATIEEAVAGDDRFLVQRNPRRLGVYRNFEHLLASVPANAALVALADQDDRWDPDKLAALAAEISGGATLAYSDMRVTDPDGSTISPSFWTARANNPDDLGALLIVNSITGGASLFRSELLDHLLPFPAQTEGSLHDHWIAMTAMSLGRVGYVDRPLYDYVQHGGAELGHQRSVAPPREARPPLLSSLRSRSSLRLALIDRLSRMRRSYAQVLRVRAAAELLLMRGGRKIPARKRLTLRRAAHIERSPAAWAWLAELALRPGARRSKTLGHERMLIGGTLWRWLLGAVKALRLPPVDPRRQTLTTMLKLPLASEPAGAAHLQSMIEPLRLAVSPGAPARVNVVVPTIDLGHFFGGYIAKFNLARKLAEGGRKVRVVVIDEPFYLPADWRREIERFEGLAGISELIEIELAHDRDRSLEVSPDDRFIATTWWTAHVAHRATRDLGAGRFLYLIQECEPLTMPMGSEAALARQSYDFPHLALFSTEFLRDYFRRHGLGVFAGPDGDADSAAFENAITAVRPPTEEEMRDSERKLLFYARPELHAERNMFELGMLALAQASEEGALDGWELHGIGAQQPGEVRLGSELRLKLLERQGQSNYAGLLRGHAVGLSLMLTPHPSLVPLEMAAAGMPVVTNTFENKTGEALGEISENLIAVEPTIEGIRDGIREAVAASADHERRRRGAEVRWSRSWDDSFDPELMQRIGDLLDRA